MMNNGYYAGIVGPSVSGSSVHEDEIEKIINEVKSQGVFDEFRRDCISDVDTKPAYQNLRSRVETSVQKFLEKLKFDSNLNKNVVRENMRKHVIESGYYNPGLDRITDQIVNPKMMPVLYPKVEKIVCEHLNIPYVPSANPTPSAALSQSLSYGNELVKSKKRDSETATGFKRKNYKDVRSKREKRKNRHRSVETKKAKDIECDSKEYKRHNEGNKEKYARELDLKKDEKKQKYVDSKKEKREKSNKKGKDRKKTKKRKKKKKHKKDEKKMKCKKESKERKS